MHRFTVTLNLVSSDVVILNSCEGLRGRTGILIQLQKLSLVGRFQQKLISLTDPHINQLIREASDME